MLQDEDENAAAGLIFFIKVQVQGKTDKEYIKVGAQVQQRKNNVEDISQNICRRRNHYAEKCIIFRRQAAVTHADKTAYM